MKPTLHFLCLSTLLLCTTLSCTQGFKASKIKANLEGSILTLTSDSAKVHNITVSIGDLSQFTIQTKGNDTINLMDSLKSRQSEHYSYAYTLATCGGKVNVKLTTSKGVDTTICSTFKYNDLLENAADIKRGMHAKIVNNLNSDKIDSELRRWAYKNNKTNLGDSLFNTMRLYLRELSTSGNTTYVVVGDIPKVQNENLNKTRYKISSDMIADHYYLYAAQNDEDIDSFIEEMISSNMEGATSSLDEEIHCFRLTGANGCQCIFLIGINNDWTVQYVPLGVVCLDSSAPMYNTSFSRYEDGLNSLDFTKRDISIDISDHPTISGNWNIESGDWQGILPYIRVPFTLEWSGDVSKITINRGDNNISTINLNGKTSPYHIDLTCKISFGDNYYEIKAYDKLGNVDRIDHCISATRITDDDDE